MRTKIGIINVTGYAGSEIARILHNHPDVEISSITGRSSVGKKIGEGVFGVSFKIKGPPKNLKTTVNPIKTLTPRFITRTIEKAKKK